MSASFESPSAGRLTAIGLPPRPAGWVPDQGAALPVAPPEPPARRDDVIVPAPQGRLDDWRLALAARLPESIAARVEQLSSRALLTGAGVLVVVALVAVVKLHAHSQPNYAASYDTPSYGGGAAASSTSDPAADGSSIVVDVGGKVRRPGLVTLPAGARVADAIRAAGGPLHQRELARIDLAARVVDGQLLMVGVASVDGGGSGSAAGPSTPVSLSTASLEQLETLPGVGPVTAQKIIDWRTAHGGFRSVAQLQQVPGIGPARYSQLSPLVAP